MANAQVYQFTVTLMGIVPPIWRRFQILGSATFEALHQAIQDSMGWRDYHLHHFVMINPETGFPDTIGINDDQEDDEEVIDDDQTRISSYFSLMNRQAFYAYDFGDNWEHALWLEDILPAESGIQYPVCLAGARACPPEDCGGVGGYENLLDAIKNPRHPEHGEYLRWLGGFFDTEAFQPQAVTFKTGYR